MEEEVEEKGGRPNTHNARKSQVQLEEIMKREKEDEISFSLSLSLSRGGRGGRTLKLFPSPLLFPVS